MQMQKPVGSPNTFQISELSKCSPGSFHQPISHSVPISRFPVQLEVKNEILKAAVYNDETTKEKRCFQGCRDGLRETGLRGCLFPGLYAVQNRVSEAHEQPCLYRFALSRTSSKPDGSALLPSRARDCQLQRQGEPQGSGTLSSPSSLSGRLRRVAKKHCTAP